MTASAKHLKINIESGQSEHHLEEVSPTTASAIINESLLTSGNLPIIDQNDSGVSSQTMVSGARLVLRLEGLG